LQNRACGIQPRSDINYRKGRRRDEAAGIFTAAFTGETGGKLRGAVDLLIAVPSQTTARIQEMHSLLGHLLCQEIEARIA